MINNDINIKEYDTLALVCDYQNDNGVLISLDNVTVTADIQSTVGQLIEPLNVRKMPETGRFALLRDTSHLPFGQYRIDILFTSDITGRRVASETFNINVHRAVTSPRG